MKIILLLLVLVTITFAQDSTTAPASGWGAYPVIYYTDQTNLAMGTYGIHYFTNPGSDYTSNINIALIYTLNKQIISEIGYAFYWRNSRLSGTVGYSKFPNIYYGVGPDSKVDDGEDYTDEGARLFLNLQNEIIDDLFAGVVYNFQSHAIVAREPGGEFASGELPGTDTPYSVSGMGLSVDYDTRDNVNYTTNGSFLQFKYIYYAGFLGSDFDHGWYDLDFRHFLPVGSDGVLGFQGTWNRVGSGSPILAYPVLGNDRLRGFSARYWDKNVLTLQAEYRHMIWGGFGAALFAGAGNVAPAMSDFSVSGLKYGAGFGLRYMALPDARLNLRIDIGIGSDNNSSVTFIAGEAF